MPFSLSDAYNTFKRNGQVQSFSDLIQEGILHNIRRWHPLLYHLLPHTARRFTSFTPEPPTPNVVGDKWIRMNGWMKKKEWIRMNEWAFIIAFGLLLFLFILLCLQIVFICRSCLLWRLVGYGELRSSDPHRTREASSSSPSSEASRRDDED